jgi:hypothetical protein
MVTCLMTFSACSQQKPITIKEQTLVLPPDNLLASPCTTTGLEGKTVRALGIAYSANFLCVEAHEKNLVLLQEWKENQINNSKK